MQLNFLALCKCERKQNKKFFLSSVAIPHRIRIRFFTLIWLWIRILILLYEKQRLTYSILSAHSRCWIWHRIFVPSDVVFYKEFQQVNFQDPDFPLGSVGYGPDPRWKFRISSKMIRPDLGLQHLS